jgi:peptidoglycan/xylan/chitin deacetylase (PgdA/CDA1 family)
MGRSVRRRVGRRARRGRRVAALAAVAALAGCGGDASPGKRPDTGRAEHRALTAERARELRADETGQVMVLEYHRVGGDPDFAPEWTISARAFRRELEYLRSHGYHPVNARDFLAGRMDVPAGKTPVVLTFDDSSDTQFTLVRRGGKLVPDPGGAVGVLLDFHRRHPDWPLRGTWFVLPKADPPNDLFGQRRHASRKLRFLVEAGMEIGSHTLYHADLGRSTPDQVREQLARSVTEIRRHLPGYPVQTLGVPFGVYPDDVSLLREGEWQGERYEFMGAFQVAGGPSAPPGSRGFDPFRVPRIQTGQGGGQTREVFREAERDPGRRYVSDGDPRVISFPKAHAGRLDLEALRAAGYTFRGY